MLLRSRVRHCIDKVKRLLNKKVHGNSGVYILTMMFVIFFILLFKGMLDKERMYVTADEVDDALVSSLIAATPVNLAEYGLSGHLVIYDDVTPPPEVDTTLAGLTEAQRLEREKQKALEFLNSVDLQTPATDSYVNGAYAAFMSSLRMNLKLDGSMNATISGIEGTVTVTDFSIYNKYERYDKKTGALLYYRFIRYYTADGVVWNTYVYPIGTDVTVFNSFDDTLTVLDSTSVSANLEFTIRVTENNSMVSIAGPITESVSYQRIVDVTD